MPRLPNPMATDWPGRIDFATPRVWSSVLTAAGTSTGDGLVRFWRTRSIGPSSWVQPSYSPVFHGALASGR